MNKDKRILGVSARTFWVYLIALVISIGLIALGFIKYCCFATWANMFMSVGESGIGGVFLAYFIELANNKRDDKNKAEYRIELFNSAKLTLNWLIRQMFWAYNRIEIEFLKKRDNGNVYQMQLGTFIDKFGVFADYLDTQYGYYDKNKQTIDTMLESVKYKIDSAHRSFASIANKYASIEKSELFSYVEINVLQAIAMELDSTGSNAVIAYSIQEAFNDLFVIREFSPLKEMTLYYKNKKVCFDTFKSDAITEEDKKNAIELK